MKTWLTPDDLEREYGFSKSTQSKYRMNKKIPFYRVGKFIKYEKSEIDDWISGHQIVRSESCTK